MTDGWVRLDDSVIDGADMGERAARAATGFAGLGVGPGDAVAWLLHNDAAVFTVTDAAGMLGAYAVPVNWHLAPDEVRTLNDLGGAHYIAHGLVRDPSATKEGGALSRAQIELVAGRVSILNDCFY